MGGSVVEGIIPVYVLELIAYLCAHPFVDLSAEPGIEPVLIDAGGGSTFERIDVDEEFIGGD